MDPESRLSPADPGPCVRDPRFDVRVLVVGGFVTGALSGGGAAGLLYLSRSRTGPDVGPRAAPLNDAFITLFGAAFGLLVGSGLTACYARRGSRMVTGIVAGFFAY